MKIEMIKKVAREEMDKWGLQDWRFKLDNAKMRFGQCSYTHRTISLSRPLSELNSLDRILDTIRHEIAHAITPHSGHDFEFMEACEKVGAPPRTHYTSKNTIMHQGKYTGT